MFRSTVTATARRVVCATTTARRTAVVRLVHNFSPLRKPLSLCCSRAKPTFIRYLSGDASQPAIKCPSCSASLPTYLPACPSCFSIRRLPQDATFFDIMEVPGDMRFDIDQDLLKRNFRRIQRVIHPDKWSSKGPEAQVLAADMSSMVNKAYQTLLNPYTRAEYILQLEGIEISESEGLQDAGLIMQVMELREALEEAENQEDVDEIRADNADNIRNTIEKISTFVESGNWEAVKKHAIELKYMQTIDAAAEAWPNTVHDH
ncbi:Co-chaperone Hsc20 [Cytidiella melzeri]|nr:Co-chaperone Hsc20 [Cytidiella melzeri]